MIIFKLLAILLFLSFSQAQEIIADQPYPGTFRKMRKQDKNLPTSYICGAGAWKSRRFLLAHDTWGSNFLRMQQVDYAKITNGIKFQYCHYEQWSRQISIEEKGVDEFLGMKMCPEGQYVHGFQTKVAQRDGVTGLILLCRSMKNSKLTSGVLIMDGWGNWKIPVVSANFALGFKAKYHGTSIVGLTFEMAPQPYIFAYNFNYQLPKDFTPSPLQIERFFVQNYGPTEMRKEIQFTKIKTFKRMWQNEKGLYHGSSQSNSYTQSHTSYNFMIPTITKTRQSYTMTQSSFQSQSQKVAFGVSQSFEVGNRHKDIVFVPGCARTIIQQIVFIYEVDIPYKLEVGLTNGEARDYEIINGLYKGVTAGEVITRVTSEKIC